MKFPGEIDIINELSKPTDVKPEVHFSQETTVEEIETPKADPKDFDYTNINNVINERSSEPEIKEEPKKPKRTFEQYKEEAKGLTTLICALADTSLVSLYRRKLITKTEYTLGKRLFRKVQANPENKNNFSDDELDLYFTILEIREFEEEQKTTEEGLNLIATQFTDCFVKWDKSSTPEVRLGMAFLSVYASRLMILIGS